MSKARNLSKVIVDSSGIVDRDSLDVETVAKTGSYNDLTNKPTIPSGTVTSVAASAGTGISVSGSPITSSGTLTITNTAPDQTVALTQGGTTTISGTYPNFTISSADQYVGTVTSVAASVPTGLSVSGSPVTSSGTLAISYASGYSIPTDTKQTNWDTAYGWGNHASAGYATYPSQTGNSGKYLTTNGSTTSWATVDASTQNTAATGFGFKNRIINGDMRIDQRNAGASLTLGSGSVAGNYTGYPVDRFMAQSYSTTTGNGASFTVQQNAGSVTPPAGFRNYIGATVTSTQATLQNSSVYRFVHRIEGFNIADLGFGTAAASSVTLSFWVRSSVAGTFTGALTNAGLSSAWRSYPFTFVINSANTWEQKTITIPGDTTGNWANTNGNGFEISFSFGASSNFSSTPNAWTTNEAYAATGGVNLMATNGATFYITGVQLEKGSTATSFDYRPYGTELALCQRYYQNLIADASPNPAYFGMGNAYTNNAILYINLTLPVQMRSLPSVNFTVSSKVNLNTPASYPRGSSRVEIQSSSAGGGDCYLYASVFNASSEL